MNISSHDLQYLVWLFVDFDALEDYPLIRITIFCAYLFLVVISFILLILYILYVIVVGKSNKFHVNLKRVLVFTKIYIMMILVCKLGLSLYEFRIIKTTGSLLADLPLVILSLMRVKVSMIAFLILPIILTERLVEIIRMNAK
ncbi:unnamed protein product, partial [Mesorhabditis belari]|uniref:Uncharacterized protein n=1 Tax=Mesorhabditis belari TaxID=2138241 RepID=A0AAF3FAS9_9BILA